MTVRGVKVLAHGTNRRTKRCLLRVKAEISHCFDDLFRATEASFLPTSFLPENKKRILANPSKKRSNGNGDASMQTLKGERDVYTRNN